MRWLYHYVMYKYCGFRVWWDIRTLRKVCKKHNMSLDKYTDQQILEGIRNYKEGK